jgi:hypothetical protein
VKPIDEAAIIRAAIAKLKKGEERLQLTHCDG